MDTSTYHYKSRRREQAGVEARIREICETRVRYGYRPSTCSCAVKVGVLVLELLQPAHLGQLQTVVLLFPIEVGRLADPGLPADVRNQHAVRALLQNERLLGVRELRCLHRPPLLPAGKP
jgi:hypothetical protein